MGGRDWRYKGPLMWEDDCLRADGSQHDGSPTTRCPFDRTLAALGIAQWADVTDTCTGEVYDNWPALAAHIQADPTDMNAERRWNGEGWPRVDVVMASFGGRVGLKWTGGPGWRNWFGTSPRLFWHGSRP